ncbi:MAG: hypothetical protein A3H02_02545 [Candidatus Niyogibacteria bacterium RIFCSPLOWO2_12_FULL_41_13]|uniref:Uncharacterized protein n=1 Tax=Candidatus Niyogibacteria bacterium RIFCSPLOWO2_12_FULL_41_13 TaxID=1801726 RepID=A0A1G2F0N5_9BACT|nr:MAG: hypothetical protein A3H02_02545 [Candidatus Niyogibacteria bacterium RIFCSPLOWO2_12_FULL_41_13]
MEEIKKRDFVNFSPRWQTDLETGCRSSDPVAFQSCRQAYFLKQQNQILQQQQSSSKLYQENNELKSEIEALKSQQTNQDQVLNDSTMKVGTVSILIFVAVVVIAALITIKTSKRKL